MWGNSRFFLYITSKFHFLSLEVWIDLGWGGEDHRFLILRGKKRLPFIRTTLQEEWEGPLISRSWRTPQSNSVTYPSQPSFVVSTMQTSQELSVVSREWDRLSALRKKRRPMTPWRVPMTFSGGEEGGPFWSWLIYNLIANLTLVGRGQVIYSITIGILMRFIIFVQGNKTLKVSENP